MRSRLLVLALMALLVLPGFAAGGDGEPWRSWVNSPPNNNALVGKIWSRHEDAFIPPERLRDAIGGADMLLLGETHDNPDHHRLQAWLLKQYASMPARRPPVVFEMLRPEQEPALQAYQAREGADAAGLGEAVGWNGHGWPDWKIYQPIAEAAFAAGLRIVSGDASQEALRAAGRQAANPLSEETRKRLRLDEPLAEPLHQALIDELHDSHCKMAPRDKLQPMADIQRFRDATFAERLIEAYQAGGNAGAVLIAGWGHVRTDRGVPWYLARRAPDKRVISVALFEVGSDGAEMASSAPELLKGKLAADFVWFTPPAPRDDPCEAFRKTMQKTPHQKNE